MELELSRILQILPGDARHLLIDRLVELHPRKSAIASKCVSATDPFVVWSSGGDPWLPASATLEAMAQVAAVLTYASDTYDEALFALHLLGVDKAKFRQPATPGDRLDIRVDLTQRRSNIWRFHAEAHVDEREVARAELLCALTHRDELART